MANKKRARARPRSDLQPAIRPTRRGPYGQQRGTPAALSATRADQTATQKPPRGHARTNPPSAIRATVHALPQPKLHMYVYLSNTTVRCVTNTMLHSPAQAPPDHGTTESRPHARGPSDDGPQTQPPGNARTTVSHGRTPYPHARRLLKPVQSNAHIAYITLKPTQFDGTHKGEDHDRRKLRRAPPPNNRVRRHPL